MDPFSMPRYTHPTLPSVGWSWVTLSNVQDLFDSGVHPKVPKMATFEVRQGR